MRIDKQTNLRAENAELKKDSKKLRQGYKQLALTTGGGSK